MACFFEKWFIFAGFDRIAKKIPLAVDEVKQPSYLGRFFEFRGAVVFPSEARLLEVVMPSVSVVCSSFYFLFGNWEAFVSGQGHEVIRIRMEAYDNAV